MMSNHDSEKKSNFFLTKKSSRKKDVMSGWLGELIAVEIKLAFTVFFSSEGKSKRKSCCIFRLYVFSSVYVSFTERDTRLQVGKKKKDSLIFDRRRLPTKLNQTKKEIQAV